MVSTCTVDFALERLDHSLVEDGYEYERETSSRLHSNSPLYTTPELSLTVTAFPMIWLRKPDGSLPSFCGAPFSILAAFLHCGFWEGLLLMSRC